MLGVSRFLAAFLVCGIAVACGSANTGALFSDTDVPGVDTGGAGGSGGLPSGGGATLGGRPSGGQFSAGGAGLTGSGGRVVGSGGASFGGIVGAGGALASGGIIGAGSGASAGGVPGAGGAVGSGGVMLGSGGAGTGGAPPSCVDSVRNQDETDVDCGGTTCQACGIGRVCLAGSDCTSTVCRLTPVGFGFCYVATCNDLMTNSAETDVDCGGTLCPTCANGKRCLLATDCASSSCVNGVCACKAQTCAQIAGACGAGVADGCGGHLTCPACSTLCTDSKKDGSETSVDCGGPDCKSCANNSPCTLPRDCQSGVCKAATSGAATTCRPATCTDGVLNAAETDVDCGGATCAKCPTGRVCKIAGDCLFDVCASGVCSCAQLTCADYPLGCGTLSDGCGKTIDCQACATLCGDGVLDGHETDIDCGGPDCDPCPMSSGCKVPGDCASSVCDSNGGPGLVCQ